jgi:hypothetical protein
MKKVACNYRDILPLILLLLVSDYLEKRPGEILPGLSTGTRFIVTRCLDGRGFFHNWFSVQIGSLQSIGNGVNTVSYSILC